MIETQRNFVTRFINHFLDIIMLRNHIGLPNTYKLILLFDLNKRKVFVFELFSNCINQTVKQINYLFRKDNNKLI